ncbi:MAG: TetR/AcrR family transcriptional regulator [Nevskia sp.]|nr:TetR/AcrR family transcriptional regulator [Nevskia sp.]
MSAADARFSQRKEPVQARSRLTVKAIIEATAQVLVAIGYERATTDTIAARAGVSIGTLYQYFPNKESLVTALIKNHVDEIMRTVEAALTEAADAPLESALQGLIHAGVEAHRADPALHKVLFEQVPRNKLLGKHLDTSGKLQAMIEAFLCRRAPGLPRARTRVVALVLETTVEALTHRAVVDAPDWLRSREIEKEALMLLRPYLLEAVT